VQVVAEIDGRTRHDVNGVTKWALTGRVLRPGDPVHDALKGAAPPRHRNPVGYFDTATLDSMPASQRAVLQPRDSASGWVIPPAAATKLEPLWAQHLDQPAPLPHRGSSRQRWQMDPARRRTVEDAAQERLMAHYRDLGWDVNDVRHGNPYDATATKDGRTLWLEAKGTETSGTAVIVTRGEVQWAREHPGDCILGILSDVTFLPNGEVDTATGTFRVFEWSPDNGNLTARDFEHTPADVHRQD
jgi:hypothetical protein